MKKLDKSLLFLVAIILILLSTGGIIYFYNDSSNQTVTQSTVPEQPPDELTILSYNVFLRPTAVSYSEYTKDRAELIGQWLVEADVDIVTLQEAWDSDAVDALIQEAKQNLPYYVVDQPTKQSDKAVSGGLLVLSRWPITHTRTLLYDDCYLDDCLATKGVLHVVVETSENTYLNVITTHLDAADMIADRQARASQIEQLRQFIAEIDPATGPIIITGDFNINSLEDNGEYDLLVNSLDVAEYDVAEPSTVNCDLISSIYCTQPVMPRQIDYIFTIEEDNRLIRVETQHHPLATDAIDQYVKYLSDHRAVIASFIVDIN